MAYDVYVSYVRSDDNDHTVRNFVDLFKSKTKFYTGMDLTVYMDFTERDYTSWKINCMERINNSHILLAILSPSYFTEAQCIYEWDLFIEKQKMENELIIFPVEIGELIEIDASTKAIKFNIEENLDEEERTRFQQAKKLSILDWVNIKNDENLAEKGLKEFSRKIDVTLRLIKPSMRKIHNIHIIAEHIDDETKKNRFGEIRTIIGNQDRAHPDIRPVCVIFTGGTAGMVRVEELNRNSPLRIGHISEVLSFIPKIRDLELDIDFYSYGTPLDSSNVTGNDWSELAEIIVNLYNYYQGFVIIHGANTMAYTASALSFAFQNLTKPIILTGAEIPLVELNSDAEYNIIRAIQIAAPELPQGAGNIPEVCILYGNSLLRGNRATKKHSLSTTQGFYSPNYGQLGYVSHDTIALDHRILRKVVYTGRQDNLEIRKLISKANIFIMDVYPEMNMGTIKKIFNDKTLVGLILRTYGTGSVPDNPSDFLDELEKLVQKGVIADCNDLGYT